MLSVRENYCPDQVTFSGSGAISPHHNTIVKLKLFPTQLGAYLFAYSCPTLTRCKIEVIPTFSHSIFEAIRNLWYNGSSWRQRQRIIYSVK
jgi:hypothetical protein